MKAIMSVLSSLVFLFSLSAMAAQEGGDNANSNVLKSESIPSPSAKADIDDEITNARLRAVSGAKTNWSFSSNFNYAGSSILTPTSSTRPQLNSQNNADPTNLNGQVAMKYRMTEHDSLLGGIGLQYTPAYTKPGSNSTVDQQTTASSPYVDYNRAFRAGSAQHVIDIAVSKYTLGSDTSTNLNWGVSLGDQVMFDVSKTKLEVGAAFGYAQDIYNGQAVQSDKQGNVSPQADYTYSQVYFEPVAEYAISDAVSLRTVYRLLVVNQDAANRTVWTTQPHTTESIGVGFAVTRNIYLYPNLQWNWDQIAADATTVGFTANINL